jgi:hypothetical protein
VFAIAVIGAFPLAKMLSTTGGETNIIVYISSLIGLWLSSGIGCIFLYGLGEILEYLYLINRKMPSAVDKSNSNSIYTTHGNTWTAPDFSGKVNKQDKSNWKCANCGKTNLGYVGTCGCGTSKNNQ